MIWIWLVAFQLHPEKKTNYTDLCTYCSLFLLSSPSWLVPMCPSMCLGIRGVGQSHLFWYPPLGISNIMVIVIFCILQALLFPPSLPQNIKEKTHGTELGIVRERNGLSVGEMCRKSGYHREIVWRYSVKKTCLNIENFLVILHVLSR